MAKVFNKIIFSVICFTFFCFLAFKTCVFHSYCVVALPIETALSGSMNIASEYLCGRAGRNIVNANEVQMNIDGVNLGSVSGDYTSVQANASGTSVPFNLDYINQYTTDIEFSSLSAADQQKFAQALADDPSANNGSWIFKKCTYGYVTLYWLVDQAGNWLGSTLNNIMASFSADTSSLSSSITNSIESDFPQGNVCYTKDFVNYSSYYTYGPNDPNSERLVNRFHFNMPVFLYTVNQSGSNVFYIVFPAGCSGTVIDQYIHVTTHAVRQYSDGINLNGTYIGTYGNLAWHRAQLLSNNSTYYTSPSAYSSYNDVLNYLSNSGVGLESVNSELVDSKQDGYTVPDFGTTYGAIISDIYEVIDSLRDGLTGILDNGLTTTIDDSLADTIADAIADALSKGLAITDEMSGGNGGGSGSDPEWSVPDWIIPPFLSDLFPDGLFDMFRPIFYIVPEAYTSYSWWILIPTIILFVIFIYFVVSVL